jgi:hypothetical protein
MPTLIVQAPRGGGVDEQLRREPPSSVSEGEVAVEALPADAAGRLSAPEGGEVVMSVLSPEALLRERDALRRTIERAGTSTQPAVVVVEAADELRAEELDAVLEAARHASRSVILRIEADG